MNSLERMAAHIEQHPDDWESRFVYADLLDDHGEHIRANGQRWQAVNKKRPSHATNSWFVVWDGWQTFYFDLNAEIVNHCCRPTIHGEHKTRQAAEDALANRLHELKIEAEVPA